jgi:hypothetical protein
MRLGDKGFLAAAVVCGLLAAAPGHALVLSATNSVQGAFDGLGNGFDPDTRTVTFGVGGIIKDVNITIDFMKCSSSDGDVAAAPPLPDDCTPGSSNAFPNEIVFSLTSPGSTLVALVSGDPDPTYSSATNGGARIQVTFDQQAPTTVGPDFVGGTFSTLDPLAKFNGETPLGVWGLSIEDQVGGDPLGFFSFTLNVSVCDVGDTDPACQRTSAVPVPATPFLLGFGLLGLAGWRRRRR